MEKSLLKILVFFLILSIALSNARSYPTSPGRNPFAGFKGLLVAKNSSSFYHHLEGTLVEQQQQEHKRLRRQILNGGGPSRPPPGPPWKPGSPPRPPSPSSTPPPPRRQRPPSRPQPPAPPNSPDPAGMGTARNLAEMMAEMRGWTPMAQAIFLEDFQRRINPFQAHFMLNRDAYGRVQAQPLSQSIGLSWQAALRNVQNNAAQQFQRIQQGEQFIPLVPRADLLQSLQHGDLDSAIYREMAARAQLVTNAVMQLSGGQLLQRGPTGGFVVRQPPATVQLAPGPGGRVPPHTLVAGTSAGSYAGQGTSYGQGRPSAGRGTSYGQGTSAGRGTSASGQQQGQPSISSAQVQQIGGQGPSRRRSIIDVDDDADQQPSSSSGSRGHHPQKMSRQYVASMFPTNPTSSSLQQQQSQQQLQQQQQPRQQQQPAQQQPRVAHLEYSQQNQLVQAYIDADPDLQAAIRYRQENRGHSKRLNKMPPRLDRALKDSIRELTRLGVVSNGMIEAKFAIGIKHVTRIQTEANLARGRGSNVVRTAGAQEMQQLRGTIGRIVDRVRLQRPSRQPIGRRRSSSPTRRSRQQQRGKSPGRAGRQQQRQQRKHSLSPSRRPTMPYNFGRGGNLGGRRRRKKRAVAAEYLFDRSEAISC